MKSRLGIGQDYPYMSARVSAKKAKLLDRNDYDNFLKMQPNEIAKNLEEGVYKKDIDALGSKYDGVRLVELALSRNLSRELSHIVELSSDELEEIVKTYLRRYDIISLKRLLRWKKGGEKGSIEDLMTPVTTYSFADLKELSEKNFEEIVEEINFDSRINYQRYLEDRETLQEIEHGLDQVYYDELEELVDSVSSPRLEEFISREIENQNLRLALRLKRYDVDEKEIRNRMLENGKPGLAEEVIGAKDFEQAVELVMESDKVEEPAGDTLEDIEHAMEAKRLKDSLKMMHTEPLGITTVLGYVIAKIIEVKNLRVLIRAKETGIHNPDTIRKNLILAK
ncbi:MAG: V-type ATPase subunit [Candidatus Nanohaloarchaea archaeon]